MTPTVVVDRECFTLTVDGVVLKPRASLFTLIEMMHRKPGRVFTRQNILDAIGRSWNTEETAIHHIKRARKLLRSVRPDHDFILTRHNLGYYWRTE